MAFKVLIVDDERDVCQAVKRILDPKFSVATTSDITKIESLLNSHDIHLILIDHDLNQTKNGIQVAKTIRENHPLIQILLFTGNTEYSLIKNAINSGSIDAFINKPILKNELVEIVTKNYEISINKRIEFNLTLQKIKDGQIKDLNYVNFGSSMPILNLLAKQTIGIKKSVIPKLIGYNISTDEGTLTEDFIDDILIIHNNFLFSKFVATVLKLGSRLLKEQVVTLQEIDLDEMKVVIKMKDDLIFSFFFINLKETPPSLDETVVNLTSEIIDLIPSKISIENNVKREIANTVFNWAFTLASN